MKLTKNKFINLVHGILILGLIFSSVNSAQAAIEPEAMYNNNKVQNTLIMGVHPEHSSKEINKFDLDYPSHDPSIKKGEIIYKQNCSKCHGANEPGKMLSVDYMRSRTPKEQYEVIAKGNFKGMPSYKNKLTREERWDVLMYVRSSILGYYEANTDELAELDKIFGGNCAVCHGTRGDGDGPLHKSLYPPPANFNQFERLFNRSDEKLFQEITHGIPWSAMPAWKDRYDFDLDYTFDQKLIRKLVRYVRQFNLSLELDRLDKGRKNLNELKMKIKQAKKNQEAK